MSASGNKLVGNILVGHGRGGAAVIKKASLAVGVDANDRSGGLNAFVHNTASHVNARLFAGVVNKVAEKVLTQLYAKGYRARPALQGRWKRWKHIRRQT